VWAAGPATIFVHLLVINGSMRAYGRAFHELKGHFGWGNDEALDALVPGAWIFIVIGALTGLLALFQLVPLFYIKLVGPMRGANAVARA
jgi:hypothetical protein